MGKYLPEEKLSPKPRQRQLLAVSNPSRLIILLFLSGQAPAAESQSTMTDQQFNGHMWLLLSNTQKMAHLTGIQEGIQLCPAQIKEDLLFAQFK